jgi:hypothetical protein
LQEPILVSTDTRRREGRMAKPVSEEALKFFYDSLELGFRVHGWPAGNVVDVYTTFPKGDVDAFREAEKIGRTLLRKLPKGKVWVVPSVASRKNIGLHNGLIEVRKTVTEPMQVIKDLARIAKDDELQKQAVRVYGQAAARAFLNRQMARMYANEEKGNAVVQVKSNARRVTRTTTGTKKPVVTPKPKPEAKENPMRTKLIAARDTEGLSWANVARKVGLPSPGKARKVYSELVRPHEESVMPGRQAKPAGKATTTTSKARTKAKAITPRWDDDTFAEEIIEAVENHTIYVQRELSGDVEQYDVIPTAGNPTRVVEQNTKGKQIPRTLKFYSRDGAHAVYLKNIVKVV